MAVGSDRRASALAPFNHSSSKHILGASAGENRELAGSAFERCPAIIRQPASSLDMNDEVRDPRVHFALRRTEWALERTQLSWVRLTFSLLSAAYAADKGTAALAAAHVLKMPEWVRGTHWGGLALAVFATLMLMSSTLSYVSRARELAADADRPTVIKLSALPVSIAVSLLGVTLCVLILTWG